MPYFKTCFQLLAVYLNKQEEPLDVNSNSDSKRSTAEWTKGLRDGDAEAEQWDGDGGSCEM